MTIRSELGLSGAGKEAQPMAQQRNVFATGLIRAIEQSEKPPERRPGSEVLLHFFAADPVRNVYFIGHSFPPSERLRQPEHMRRYMAQDQVRRDRRHLVEPRLAEF